MCTLFFSLPFNLKMNIIFRLFLFIVNELIEREKKKKKERKKNPPFSFAMGWDRDPSVVHNYVR